MGLIERLAGEPNYDGMPDPEPPWENPLPCFVCGGTAEHEFRATGAVDYGVCHAHRGQEPLAPPEVSWGRTPLEQDPDDPNHYTYTSPGVRELEECYRPPAPPPVLHQWVSAEPRLKVKLESHGDPQGAKCYRTWEVSYEGANPEAVLAMLELVDDHLQARYGGLP